MLLKRVRSSSSKSAFLLADGCVCEILSKVATLLMSAGQFETACPMFGFTYSISFLPPTLVTEEVKIVLLAPLHQNDVSVQRPQPLADVCPV